MADGSGGGGGGGERPRKTEGVGYGRPPKHSQFKKGQPSANPKGRPKKDRSDFRAAVKNLLSETTVVTLEGGKKVKMPNRDLLLRLQLRSAQKGSALAAREFNRLAERYDVDPVRTDQETEADKELRAKHNQMMIDYLEWQASEKKKNSESYKLRVARAQAERAAAEGKKAEDDDDGGGAAG